jgi:hypothetical protein
MGVRVRVGDWESRYPSLTLTPNPQPQSLLPEHLLHSKHGFDFPANRPTESRNQPLSPAANA